MRSESEWLGSAGVAWGGGRGVSGAELTSCRCGGGTDHRGGSSTGQGRPVAGLRSQGSGLRVNLLNLAKPAKLMEHFLWNPVGSRKPLGNANEFQTFLRKSKKPLNQLNLAKPS